MFKTKQITTIVFMISLFSILLALQANAIETKEIIAKKIFIKTETVSRLDNKEQKQHIKNLYQDIYPTLQTLKVFGIFPGPFISKEELKLSPKKLADVIAEDKHSGWPWLIQFSINNCLDIFKTNQEHLIPFVKKDIESQITANKKRALYVIRDLNLTNFFKSIVYVLETDSSLFGIATITLRDIDNPKAIAPIVRTCPNLQRNMVFGYLRLLQRGRSADPSLITLLESKDPEVRWRAGYALAESNDPKLIPYVFRLSKDKNAMVRKQASNIGLCIKGKNFEKVRPALITLLHDSSTKVKLFTAICLAQRKDTVCASTLLDLLKDDSLIYANNSNVVGAMYDITGSYFGYDKSPGAWKPTTENNQRAIKQFAKWIKNNVENNNLKNIKQISGVILPTTNGHYVPYSPDGKTTGVWTPTMDQIIKAQPIILKYIEKSNKLIYNNINNYRCQYFGIIVNGKKRIYCNFFRLRDFHKNWQTKPVIVDDGGNHYFQLEYDIETGKCLNFLTNSNG